LLLELTGDAGIEGKVAGIVRSRRQLIDLELAIDNEELIISPRFISKLASDSRNSSCPT